MSSLEISIETFVVVLIHVSEIVLDSGSVTVLPVSYCTREEPMLAGLCEGLEMQTADANGPGRCNHSKGDDTYEGNGG
jgi:hypothetical protein